MKVKQILRSQLKTLSKKLERLKRLNRKVQGISLQQRPLRLLRLQTIVRLQNLLITQH